MHQWDRLVVPGRYTAFSNNKKMVTILHRELEHEVEKVQHMKLEVMQPKTKNKIYEFPAWIYHNWSVHVNFLLFVKNNDGGKDKANSTFWLANWADKLGSSCLLLISNVGPKRDHIISSLLTRLVCSRWLYIGLVLFYIFIDLNFILVYKKCKKKDLANIQVRSLGKQVSFVLPRVLMLSGLSGKQN